MQNTNSRLKHITGMCCIIGCVCGALAGFLDASINLAQSLRYPVNLIDIIILLIAAPFGYALCVGLSMATLGAACCILSMTTQWRGQKHIPGALAGIFCAGVICLTLASGPLKQRLMEAGLILVPFGLCLATGIYFFTVAGIERLQKKPVVVASVLLTAFWTVFLINIFLLLFLNNHALREVSFLLRIIISAALLTSLAVSFKVVLQLWGSVMQGRRPGVKKSLAYLIVLSVVLLAADKTVSFSLENKRAQQSITPPQVTNIGPMPNILWIVMDTVRADHLSCYGYHLPTTPFIDSLAREGAVFENAFSTAPWTLPAHASMFTGMYPITHQTTNNHQFLSYRLTTIADVLRDNGYMTAGFSNNAWVSHMTNLSNGFDHFFEGFAAAGTDHLWTDLFISRTIFRILNVEHAIQRRFRDWKSARQTNIEIDTWFKKQWNPDRPFFIFINYMEAHTPLNPPEHNTRPFLPETISYQKALRVNQNNMLHYAGVVDMKESDFDSLKVLYDGTIHYLDSQIANLVDSLRAMKVLDNTIVIITSDHGENIGENGKMGHVFSVDDNLLHVPLIVRYPKEVPAGQRITRAVQIHQIFATLLDLVGIEWPGRTDLQGESLFREESSEKSPVSMALAELNIFFEGIRMINQFNRNCFVDDYARTFKTIRDKGYKYIMASDGRDELYDMVNDPGETSNVIAEYPDRAREMNAQLRTLLNSLDIPDLREPDGFIADQATMKTLDALKSLGYAQ